VENRGLIANRELATYKLVIQERNIWKDNTIQTNRANLAAPDSKVASKIARNRNVSASSASVKNKVAANRVAVSKGDDKPRCSELTSGGRRLPPPQLIAGCEFGDVLAMVGYYARKSQALRRKTLKDSAALT
jgi:hypothetical protein